MVNPKGYFPTNESHLQTIDRKPKDVSNKRYVKRHYPPQNPLMKDVPGFDQTGHRRNKREYDYKQYQDYNAQKISQNK